MAVQDNFFGKITVEMYRVEGPCCVDFVRPISPGAGLCRGG